MDLKSYDMYWNYYISIEKMLIDTNQIVVHSKNNELTFSNEFTKIILLSCAEIDTILKDLCELLDIKSNGKRFVMKDYAKALLKCEDIRKIGFCINPTMSYNDKRIEVYPFKNIDCDKEYAGLEWWNDYQAIKHNRIFNDTKGNLLNAIKSVVAQYVIIRMLIENIPGYAGISYVREKNITQYFNPIGDFSLKMIDY